MIEQVEIKNFQSHKDTTLEFHPGLNIIKGESHGGKSSIMRALQWALMNAFRGSGVKSHFAKKKDITEVTVGFDDGWIKKSRGTKIVYETSESSSPLTALRSDLPEEITSVTRMGDINIQGQFDPYYLLSSSPGEAARTLNEMVGLDSIDFFSSAIFSRLAKQRLQITNIQNSIEETEESLTKFKDLTEIEKKVKKIEDLYNYKRDVDGNLNRLQYFQNQIQKRQDKIQGLKNTLEMEDCAKRLSLSLVQYEDCLKRIGGIQILSKRINERKEYIHLLETFLKSEAVYQRAYTLANEAHRVGNQHSRISETHKSIQKRTSEARVHADRVFQLEKSIEKLRSEFDFCPFCNQSMKGIKHEHHPH